MSTRLPMAVLSQELAKAVGGRAVRVALFTTYTFNPGFFELQVLPILFDQSFSQADKLRLVQLEEALRSLEHIAVYYDRSALAQDAEPARLDYRRLDVHRGTGAFHPKLIMLLVEETTEGDDEQVAGPVRSLVVGVLSANLTRGGWWENVECAHFEELKDRDIEDSRTSFRTDLLAIVRRIRGDADEGEDHAALDAIHEFLRRRASKREYAYASSGGHYHTRLFGGRARHGISDWLWSLNLTKYDWNLEVISPFFDSGGAGPLALLMETLDLKEVRVMLPRDADGTALVTEATYTAVVDLGAKWSRLPPDVLARGRTADGERLVPRFVHAKLYRLWRQGGPDIVLAGSPNLSTAAHGHGGAGNLEAAFLFDVSDAGWPRRWFLEPLDSDTEKFAKEAPGENDGLDPVPIDLVFRFDWSTRCAAYRLGTGTDGTLDIRNTAGHALFRIDTPKAGDWVECGEFVSKRLRKHLRSSSFLLIRHPHGEWRVLVREEHMPYRPSLFSDLTPEEILEYWSLLTPEQRAAFLEQHAGIGLEIEGLAVAKRTRLGTGNTLFDRFAGLYHAFGCLKRHIEEAVTSERAAEAEARLFGAKYDSLPVLLEKTLAQEDIDPVFLYVTFLAAKQLRRQVKQRHPEFYRQCRGRTGQLEGLIARLGQIRQTLPLPAGRAEAFLDWYQPAFLKDLSFTANEDDHN